jgi:hypothetical protein
MLKKSILSVLSGTFSSNNAPAAAATMRSLSAAEISAVAGGPDYDHDVRPLTFAAPVPPAK